MRQILFASLFLFSSAQTFAQADQQDEAVKAMKACREISVDQVRLACLDAATLLLERLDIPDKDIEAKQALANERAELAGQRETLARERAALEALKAEEAAVAEAKLKLETENLVAEREALEKEKEALETALNAKKEADGPGKGLLSAPRGLGLFDGDDRPKKYYTTVTRIIVNQAGRHFFETSDGTTWRQVPPVPLRATPSSLPANVTIRRTGSGARRLSFEEHPGSSYTVIEADIE